MTAWQFSKTLNKMRRNVVTLELISVFVVSVFVSWLRFDRHLYSVVLEYPGQPKILAYPLMWYAILHLIHGWDRSIFLNSNQYYVRIVVAGGYSLVAFSSFAYLVKFPISRIWLVANVVATTAILLLLRLILKRIYIKNYDPSQLVYLYVGNPASKSKYMSEFESYYGYMPRVEEMNAPEIGREDSWLEDFEQVLIRHEINGVVVGYGEINDAALLNRMADTQRSQIVDFLLVSRISSMVHKFEVLENPTLVRIRESHIVASGSVVKRLVDIFLSLVLLLALLPLFALVALIIKITSKGPILYTAKRVGQNGDLFIFPKFRSMYVGSDNKRAEILGTPDSEMLSRYKNDPRITPFGRFIRRWSIDELPQLWCVLIGTMSMVGPRPVLPEELPQIDSKFKIRFIAKPGLTGLWQVSGRKEVAWEDRMLRDIAYIDNWSIATDFILILKTIQAIVSGRGAH